MKKKLTFKQFFEAQLANVDKLKEAINNVLSQRGIEEGTPIHNWFMTKYVKWYQSPVDDEKKSITKHNYTDGEPAWMSNDNVMEFTGFNNDENNKIIHFIDYFNSLEERDLSKIYKQNYDVVEQKVQEWDKQLASQKNKPANKLVEGKDYKVIKSLGEYKWVHLLTKEAYKCEGNTMGHCVGGYTPGKQDILSLWDAQQNPHVTIEIKDKNIHQIKGKQNSAPVEKYQQPTINLVKSLIDKGYNVKSDGENIGMLQYNNVYYFPDSKEWNEIYEKEIIPMQQKKIKEIMDMIEIVDVPEQ